MAVGIIRILITLITPLTSNLFTVLFVVIKALVKTNKKNKKLLRCDFCYALIFANGHESQQILVNLQEFREYY